MVFIILVDVYWISLVQSLHFHTAPHFYLGLVSNEIEFELLPSACPSDHSFALCV